ncbi:RNA polymerase sigma-70 factor (sigma-E family) [Kineococcus xinjiangensis]|uniref:RNA polymerase sigma-70 factor (Sigma-E family) n=1 Tax=Kineococcus xinjiangensis TaxID=512762 RepID=A0A2S6IG95_9ACTN|nr:SigE family RNA polymerase sigma factor [Kineococcus xinjiangensis]PPK93216.1 RNA polymerase sigma-70 factor (sigma-E family) [Kineococcus xinjiangensis]
MSGDADFDAWAVTATPRLLRTARLLAADTHAGEDLLQDVMERVFVKWARIDDPSGYAHRALVHAATSRWRSRSRRREVTWDAVGEPAAPGSSGSTSTVDDRDEALAILRRLPARQRAVLVLRYLEDLPEQEVADLLGIGLSTVKSHSARALTALRASRSTSSTHSTPLPWKDGAR